MSQAAEDTPWTRYAPVQAWDEAVDIHGKVREPYARVYAEIDRMSGDDLYARAESLASTYLAQGVTFDFAGEERPFPLDVVPRVIAADEWEHIAPGVAQRVRALEAFLADVYGPQQRVAGRRRARAAVISSTALPSRRRAASTRRTACACTSPASTWSATATATGACSRTTCACRRGVSYVLSNRRAMAQMFPELFAAHAHPARRRLPAAAARRADARRRRPASTTPRSWCSRRGLQLRVLTSTRCSPARWASSSSRAATSSAAQRPRLHAHHRTAGAGSMSSTAASMTTTSTRSRSAPIRTLGAPGHHQRRPRSATSRSPTRWATAWPTTSSSTPTCRTSSGTTWAKTPILPNVDTWRLEEPDALEEVLDRLAELVVKPVDGAGGKGVVIGPRASKEELETAARADPRRPPRLDRAARRAALHRANAHRGRPRAAPRRPAALRRQRRRRRVGPARRAHPRRARRGSAHRQLLAGRRVQGHVGAWRASVTAAPWRRRRSRASSSPAWAPCRRPRTRTITRRPTPAQQQQQQTAAAAPSDEGSSHAEPHRRVALLDRPLRGARGRHRPPARRAPQRAARGPVGRRDPAPTPRCSTS